MRRGTGTLVTNSKIKAEITVRTFAYFFTICIFSAATQSKRRDVTNGTQLLFKEHLKDQAFAANL